MTPDDLDFPHGTPRGAAMGCKTSHCPAVLPCREVAQRYRGDFTFRRQLDSGMTVAEILEAESRARDAVKLQEREAERARQNAAVAERRQAKERERAIAKEAAAADRARERAAAAAQRHLEREATRLARQARADDAAQRREHLRAELSAARRTRAAVALRAAAAPGTSARGERLHAEAAAAKSALEAAELQLAAAEGVPLEEVTSRPQKHPGRPASVAYDEKVRELYGERLIDREIAAQLGIPAERVMRIRHRLGLDKLRPEERANKPVRRQPRPREVKGCGTNAAWARGCDCPRCEDAHRQYHRDYTAARRKNGGAGLRHGVIRHGTPSGYQLGCHDKAACPAPVSCSEASLEAERTRRRAAGVQERVMVDAAPARERVRVLMSAGMNVRAIAEAAGLGHTAVGNLAYGKRGRELEQVVSTTAERLLALPVPAVEAAP